MNNYYLHNGTDTIGPFDLEALKEKKITKDTSVWCEGMKDWMDAGEVEALKSILFVVPPPIKKIVEKPETFSKQETRPEKKKTNWLRWVGILALISILGIVAIGVIGSILYSTTATAPSYEESIMTIAETEAAYPVNYLSAGGKYHETFLGDKIKIEGVIVNKATVTTYKDVVIEVTFYSKTDTPINTENYTIYEFYTPTSRKEFKLKVTNYSNIKSIGWEVVGATVKP